MTDRVIVEHKDGRRYSVPTNDPRAKGEDGWTVEGEETDASFVAIGIPKPKKVRSKPKPKAVAPIVEPEA